MKEILEPRKPNHAACAIRRQIGECNMPEEGIFARVVKEGLVRPRDRVKIGDVTQ
ncbi:hypothetical protein ES703_82881 [subsurface metagenome]